MRKDVCSPCRERKVKCELLSETGPCKGCIDRGIICPGPVPTQVKKKRLQEFRNAFDIPSNEPASFVMNGSTQQGFLSPFWPSPAMPFIPNPWSEVPSAPVVLDYYANEASHTRSRGPMQDPASSLLPMINGLAPKQTAQGAPQPYPEWGLLSGNPSGTSLYCPTCGALFDTCS